MSTESIGFDRSLDLVLNREDFRAGALGFGHTDQGRRLVDQYRQQLAFNIAADRAVARNKTVWDALGGIDDDTLAKRLLLAGVSLCHSESIGADGETGEKNLRDSTLWIGRSLCLDGRQVGLNFKVGRWGIGLLATLPIFILRDDGLIDIELTAAQDEFLTAIVQLA